MISFMDVRDVASCPTMHRTAPSTATKKHSPLPDSNSAETETPAIAFSKYFYNHVLIPLISFLILCILFYAVSNLIFEGVPYLARLSATPIYLCILPSSAFAIQWTTLVIS